MKIAHVITRLIIGGAQENTVLTCRGLVERGHEVALIAGPETGPEGSLWEQARASGARLFTAQHLRRAVSPWQDALALAELARIYREFKPDIVHTHSSKAGILGRMAARRAGVPHIVHTIHGMSFNRTQPWMIRRAYRALERRVAQYTDLFVTVADSMIEQSVAAGIAPREKFRTVRSGMEVARFCPDAAASAKIRSSWGVADHQIVVGTVARLFKDKGYEEILSAMPRMILQVAHLHFVWVGDGPHRGQYQDFLARDGLSEKVSFVGLVPPERIPEVINGFDILLHASKWEGLPRAVVQGLLLGKPAVCFSADGAPEVVEPLVTGLLAPLGDVESIGQHVVHLAQDKELRLRMGAEGRRRCLDMFSWVAMVDQLEALYSELVRKRRGTTCGE